MTLTREKVEALGSVNTTTHHVVVSFTVTLKTHITAEIPSFSHVLVDD